MSQSVLRHVLGAASVTLGSSKVQLAVCVHISVAALTPQANITASTQPTGPQTTVVSSVHVAQQLERFTATRTTAREEWSASSCTTRECVNLKNP